MEIKINRQTNIKIPSAILIISTKELNFNDKLIYGLHYSYSLKGKITHLTNKEIGAILNIKENTVQNSRKKMCELGYLVRLKKGQLTIVEEKLTQLEEEQQSKSTKAERDLRAILLPFEIYNSDLVGGAKLLWGEFNTFRETKDGYKSMREYTSKRLSSSESSISNWTTLLNDKGFLDSYNYNRSHNGSQRTIRTKHFERDSDTIIEEELPLLQKTTKDLPLIQKKIEDLPPIITETFVEQTHNEVNEQYRGITSYAEVKLRIKAEKKLNKRGNLLPTPQQIQREVDILKQKQIIKDKVLTPMEVQLIEQRETMELEQRRAKIIAKQNKQNNKSK